MLIKRIDHVAERHRNKSVISSILLWRSFPLASGGYVKLSLPQSHDEYRLTDDGLEETEASQE